jgi:signal transduction histidine kinase
MTTPATPEATEALRLRAVLDQIGAGVMLEDAHRRLVMLNPALCSLFGITDPPASLVGRDGVALAERWKPLFREPEAFTARMNRVVANRTPVRGERCTMLDGRVLEREYVPLHMDGMDRGHLWTYRDVTALVQATERVHDLSRFQRQVLESLPVQLAVFDTELRYRFVTPSAVRSAEMREWLIGKTDFDYAQRRNLDPSMPTLRAARQREVIETRAPVEFEETLTDREGKARVYRRSISPVVNERNEVVYLLGYGMDVTEERAALAALADARQLAETTARARERFLSTMSQRIHAPLNGILGTAHMLRATSLTPQQREHVDATLFAGENLLTLVNDVLDFTRIEVGGLPLEELAFRPRELLSSVIAATRPLADRRGLGLRLSVAPRVPEGVIGDPARLRQVVINLVANAIKFTPQGQVEVLVDAVPFADGRVGFLIRVVDTGVGIAEDRLDRIFTPFTQGEDEGEQGPSGTGLGLAIVRQLVERQGGAVSVESVLGSGSTFTVRLPMRVAPEEALAPALAASASEGPRLDGMRILLVEDSTLDQLVASYLLQQGGAEVVIRESGRAALELLRDDPAFNVVLMDVQMPGLDGLETTRLIRDQLGLSVQRLPVIALTALTLVERREEALAVGMNLLMSKPVRAAELRTAIKRVVGGRTPAYGTPLSVRAVQESPGET